MTKKNPLYGLCYECRKPCDKLPGKVARGAYPFFYFCEGCRRQMRLRVVGRLTGKP